MPVDGAVARPRVDFYILREAGEQAVELFVCRLVEKAWRGGHRVYVNVPDPAAVQRLDRLMWTYRQDSFLPHEPWRPEVAARVAPVLIGSLADEPLPEDREVLVNTAHPIPSFYGGFRRVAEIVSADPAGREAGRDRYRHYRGADVELRSHEV